MELEGQDNIRYSACARNHPPEHGERIGILWENRTIQISAWLRSARILSRVLETWGDLLLFRLQWKTRNSQGILLLLLIIIIIIMIRGDRDETIRECSKLAQKEYKISDNWVGKEFTGNFARNWSLTIRTNGICTTQHMSWRMRHANSSGILRYKRIT